MMICHSDFSIKIIEFFEVFAPTLLKKLNKYDVIMYVATTPIPVSTLIEGERADRKLTFLNLN